MKIVMNANCLYLMYFSVHRPIIKVGFSKRSHFVFFFIFIICYLDIELNAGKFVYPHSH